MDYKEILELFLNQIRERDKLVNKLLQNEVENRKFYKFAIICTVIIAVLLFLICITMVISYFFADWSNTSSISNEINNVVNTIKGGFNYG